MQHVAECQKEQSGSVVTAPPMQMHAQQLFCMMAEQKLVLSASLLACLLAAGLQVRTEVFAAKSTPNLAQVDTHG